MPQKQFQLKLDPAEKDKIAHRILADHDAARSAHQLRMSRYVEYYNRWRTRYTPNPQGEESKPNFRVPMVKWSVYQRWADELDQLLGDDAQVIAEPIGPTDERNVRKLSRYMTWRLFSSMKAVKPIALFTFRKILFGRSHAYRPWVRDTFTGDNGEEIVHYEGPGFFPLWPDDLWMPAEDVERIHDFRFVLRKFWDKPSTMLKRELEGFYDGVKSNYENLVNQARSDLEREETDDLKREADAGEGVVRSAGYESRENLRIWEWYGPWRMLRNKRDKTADEYDLTKRELTETELVVRYERRNNLVLSVQKLTDLYPNMRYPRPFVEASVHPDGSYWPAGFGESLGEIEEELTKNHNIGTEGGQLAAGPIILYEPASGFDPEEIALRPRTAIPTQNAQGARVIMLTNDFKFTAMHAQALLGYGERVSSVSDLNLGRSQDAPNAPRTFGQASLMFQAGNQRVAFDTIMHREDLSDWLQANWQLDNLFAPKDLFFRVTEAADLKLFANESQNGFLPFSAISVERGLSFDFKMKFATSRLNREAQRERDLALYQIDIQNPLIIENPRALWLATKRVHDAFGDSGFHLTIPEPQDTEPSISPQEELARLQGGEEINIRSLDNDRDHLDEHEQQLRMLAASMTPDQRVIGLLTEHYHEHIAAMRHKALMQALLQDAQQKLPDILDRLGPLLGAQQNGQGQPGGQAGPAGPGAAGGAQQASALLQPG